MKIGDRIRAEREKQRMTLDELSKSVGVSRQTLSRYETGVIANIPSDKIESIALALGITPTHIMGWEDNPINQNKEEMPWSIGRLLKCLQYVCYLIKFEFDSIQILSPNGELEFKGTEKVFDLFAQPLIEKLEKLNVNSVGEFKLLVKDFFNQLPSQYHTDDYRIDMEHLDKFDLKILGAVHGLTPFKKYQILSMVEAFAHEITPEERAMLEENEAAYNEICTPEDLEMRYSKYNERL